MIFQGNDKNKSQLTLLLKTVLPKENSLTYVYGNINEVEVRSTIEKIGYFSLKNIKQNSVLMVTSFYPKTIKQAPPVFNMLICGLSSKGF